MKIKYRERRDGAERSRSQRIARRRSAGGTFVSGVDTKQRARNKRDVYRDVTSHPSVQLIDPRDLFFSAQVLARVLARFRPVLTDVINF